MPSPRAASGCDDYCHVHRRGMCHLSPAQPEQLCTIIQSVEPNDAIAAYPSYYVLYSTEPPREMSLHTYLI